MERETARDEVQDRIELAEAEIAEWKREQYLMAILIDNLIAEELRKSAPDLTKESGQGFILPIDKSSKITSSFGMRTHPILGVKRISIMEIFYILLIPYFDSKPLRL